MNKLLLSVSAISLIFAGQAQAAENDSLSKRIQKLEQEIKLLKRQQEVADEKTASSAEKNANVEIGKKGLNITSPDKKYQLAVHGIFQFDNRNFINDKSANANNLKNDTLVRRARPIIDVKAGNASLYFMPDFAGSSTKIFDAYAEYKFNDKVKVRFGKFKPPIGLEQLQSDPDVFFTERGYAASLTPSRDEGIQISGQLIPDVLDYQFGIFNGSPDLGNNDNDSDDKKDLTARIFVKPFRNSNIVTLQGFGIGVGGSIGDREGTSANTIISSSSVYVTPSQQTFFRYSSGSYSNGTQWRLSPQAYWFSGNKGFLAEYAVSTQDIVNGSTIKTLQNQAWQVTTSYVITGEDLNFSGGVKPTKDFNPKDNSWGAWEVVARAGQLIIDDATYPTFASITISAQKATSYGVGINWYLSENLKLATNYNFTQFDGGNTANRDRADEHAILSRVQFRF